MLKKRTVMPRTALRYAENMPGEWKVGAMEKVRANRLHFSGRQTLIGYHSFTLTIASNDGQQNGTWNQETTLPYSLRAPRKV